MAGAHGGLKGKGPFCYEANSHVPLIIAHPDARPGTSCSALTSHLDLLPTLVGMTGLPEEKRSAAVKGLPGHDFAPLLGSPEAAAIDANRKGVLFNYVGIATVDGKYLETVMVGLAKREPAPPLTEIDLNKRGFLSFVFDGRYKFGRYYAPNAFNAPKTLEQIFQYNDVQLFDLKDDPDDEARAGARRNGHDTRGGLGIPGDSGGHPGRPPGSKHSFVHLPARRKVSIAGGAGPAMAEVLQVHLAVVQQPQRSGGPILVCRPRTPHFLVYPVLPLPMPGRCRRTDCVAGRPFVGTAAGQGRRGKSAGRWPTSGGLRCCPSGSPHPSDMVPP
jgi:hypothetical protein